MLNPQSHKYIAAAKNFYLPTPAKPRSSPPPTCTGTRAASRESPPREGAAPLHAAANRAAARAGRLIIAGSTLPFSLSHYAATMPK